MGLLPDGKRIVYFEGTSAGIGHTYVQAFSASERAKIADRPVVYASGYLLIWSVNSIMAQRFDLGRLKAEGEPMLVASGDWNNGNWDVSQNGVMALQPPRPSRQLQLTWFDRTGKRLGTVVQHGLRFNNAALSPDEKRLVFNEGGDLHLLDMTRGTDSRLASKGGDAVWSPDGSRIAFSSNPGKGDEIFVKSAFGTGPVEVLLNGASDFAMDWSPDGNWLAYTRYTGTFSI